MPDKPDSGKPREEETRDEVVEKWPNGFLPIPVRIARDRRLSHGAKLLAGVLRFYAWKKDYCWPSQDTLRGWLGVSRNTLRARVSELRNAGYIETELGQGNTRARIVYRLKYPAAPGVERSGVQNGSSPGSDADPTGVSPLHGNDQQVNDNHGNDNNHGPPRRLLLVKLKALGVDSPGGLLDGYLRAGYTLEEVARMIDTVPGDEKGEGSRGRDRVPAPCAPPVMVTEDQDGREDISIWGLRLCVYDSIIVRIVSPWKPTGQRST